MTGNSSKDVRADLLHWLKAIIYHWVASTGCALVATFQICYAIWRREWPPALSWAILAGCFVSATFLAWRDEYRKTIGKERRSILNKVVELNSSGNTDIFGALIKVSDEFGSDEDVEWVCRQLDEQRDYDPFAIVCAGAVWEPGFDGKRLKFLQDARVARIGSLEEAIQYFLSGWYSKNGLHPKKNRVRTSL